MQHGNACARFAARPWPLLAATAALWPRRALLLLALALLAPSVPALPRAHAPAAPH